MIKKKVRRSCGCRPRLTELSKLMGLLVFVLLRSFYSSVAMCHWRERCCCFTWVSFPERLNTARKLCRLNKSLLLQQDLTLVYAVVCRLVIRYLLRLHAWSLLFISAWILTFSFLPPALHPVLADPVCYHSHQFSELPIRFLYDVLFQMCDF